MPALNYTLFVEKVEAGTKRQTIRATRKRPIKVGERLHHFTGMRTKHCRRLRAGVLDLARRANLIEMRFSRNPATTEPCWWTIKIGGAFIKNAEALAKADGFESLEDFLVFFHNAADVTPRGSRLFEGQLIAW